MFLFVPLGDKFERRSLILRCSWAHSCRCYSWRSRRMPSGWAPRFAVGAFAANVHVVVPFAAHLAAPQQRGRVVGTVVAGILFGVLLARTFSGFGARLAGAPSMKSPRAPW